MVRAFRAAAAGFVSLSLLSCQFLFSGPFPQELAQASRRIDLSSFIPADIAGSYNLAVLESQQGWEYVVLFNSSSTDPATPHLVIMSPDFTVLQTYTYDELSAMFTAAPFKGTHAMRDADNFLVIGNVRFTSTAANSPTPFDKLITPLSLEYPSISGAPFVNTENFANFYVDISTNSLVYNRYDVDWNFLGPRTVNVGLSGVSLCAVGADPIDLVNDRVVLVFEQSSSTTTSTYYFVQVSKTALSAGLSSPVIGNSAYAQFTKPDLDPDSIFFTRDGMTAISYNNARSWIRFTFDAPDQQSTISVGNLPLNTTDNTIYGFSITGDYYCAWDPATEILTRYEKWW